MAAVAVPLDNISKILLKGSAVSVTVEEYTENVILVKLNHGLRVFKGVLLDSNSRWNQFGVNPQRLSPNTSSIEAKTTPCTTERYSYKYDGQPSALTVYCQNPMKRDRKPPHISRILRPRRFVCRKCKKLFNIDEDLAPPASSSALPSGHENTTGQDDSESSSRLRDDLEVSDCSSKTKRKRHLHAQENCDDSKSHLDNGYSSSGQTIKHVTPSIMPKLSPKLPSALESSDRAIRKSEKVKKRILSSQPPSQRGPTDTPRSSTSSKKRKHDSDTVRDKDRHKVKRESPVESVRSNPSSKDKSRKKLEALMTSFSNSETDLSNVKEESISCLKPVSTVTLIETIAESSEIKKESVTENLKSQEPPVKIKSSDMFKEKSKDYTKKKSKGKKLSKQNTSEGLTGLGITTTIPEVNSQTQPIKAENIYEFETDILAQKEEDELRRKKMDYEKPKNRWMREESMRRYQEERSKTLKKLEQRPRRRASTTNVDSTASKEEAVPAVESKSNRHSLVESSVSSTENRTNLAIKIKINRNPKESESSYKVQLVKKDSSEPTNPPTPAGSNYSESTSISESLSAFKTCNGMDITKTCTASKGAKALGDVPSGVDKMVSVQSCSTDKNVAYNVNDVVWAKITGWPFWPSKILTLSYDPTKTGKSRTHTACVSWYAWDQISYITCDKLFHFQDHYNSKFIKKKKGAYKLAVDQAWLEAESVRLGEHPESEEAEASPTSPSFNPDLSAPSADPMLIANMDLPSDLPDLGPDAIDPHDVMDIPTFSDDDEEDSDRLIIDDFHNNVR